MPKKTTKPTRRSFVKTSAAVGAGFWAAGGVAPKRTYASRLDEIQYACIGIGGKGSSDSDDAKRTGKVVGVCDIDANTLEKGKAKFTEAKQFFDFREMLDQMGDKIDAVTVSTPDHTHAVAALYAMRMGKHCFCQKPLSHSIQEARMMGELAKEKNLVTQMGNQGTAGSILRKSAALLANGAIGDVKHVHVWTNRPVWPQGIDINVAEPSTPGHVHWDEWIGPAVSRPYSPEIHPFKWRGFWAFGTGALGDMACHTLTMAFMGLNLKNPTSVAAVTSGHDKVMYPKWSEIEFEFPENEGRPALGMTWYDGGKKPPVALIKDLPKSGRGNNASFYNSGALVVGTEGMLFSPGDYGGDQQGNTGIIRPDGTFEKQRRIDVPENFFKVSPGHFDEFSMGIAGKDPSIPVSNFPNYAGPLTETILLGNLAVWAASDKPVDWDADTMTASNVPAGSAAAVEEMVRHTYHNGYGIENMASAGK